MQGVCCGLAFIEFYVLLVGIFLFTSSLPIYLRVFMNIGSLSWSYAEEEGASLRDQSKSILVSAP